MNDNGLYACPKMLMNFGTVQETKSKYSKQNRKQNCF